MNDVFVLLILVNRLYLTVLMMSDVIEILDCPMSINSKVQIIIVQRSFDYMAKFSCMRSRRDEQYFAFLLSKVFDFTVFDIILSRRVQFGFTLSENS